MILKKCFSGFSKSIWMLYLCLKVIVYSSNNNSVCRFARYILGHQLWWNGVATELESWSKDLSVWFLKESDNYKSIKQKKKKADETVFEYTWLSFPWVPHLQIQPAGDWKHSPPKFQKVLKSKTWISQDWKLFTLYLQLFWQLFTYQLHCIRYYR